MLSSGLRSFRHVINSSRDSLAMAAFYKIGGCGYEWVWPYTRLLVQNFTIWLDFISLSPVFIQLIRLNLH